MLSQGASAIEDSIHGKCHQVRPHRQRRFQIFLLVFDRIYRIGTGGLDDMRTDSERCDSDDND
jgi:hypothetical protein